MHQEDDQWDKLWVTQKVALWRSLDNTFLLVKGTDPRFEERYPEYEQWGFLGGHIDIEEKIEDNLKRELEEEAGKIEYEIIGPVYISQLNDIKVTYLAEYKSGEVTLSPEHSELRWETAVEIEKGEKYHPLLKEAIKKATERLMERAHLNDLKRLQADFENYRKRQAESQRELGGYLIEKLVLDIVPVLDNFRSATMHVPPEQKDSPWVVGIQYIEKQ